MGGVGRESTRSCAPDVGWLLGVGVLMVGAFVSVGAVWGEGHTGARCVLAAPGSKELVVRDDVGQSGLVVGVIGLRGGRCQGCLPAPL